MARRKQTGETAPTDEQSQDSRLTLPELHRQLEELTPFVNALADKIAQHSLAALADDPEAKACVAQWDEERRQLLLRKELLSNAITQREREAREAREVSESPARGAVKFGAQHKSKNRDFERNRTGWVRSVRFQVIERWGNIGLNLAKLINEGRFEEANAHWLGEPLKGMPRGRDTPVSPVDIPATVARELVDPICVMHKKVPSGDKFLLVEEIDIPARDRLVDQLLSEAKLPALPQTLEKFIAFSETLDPATPQPSMPANERQPDKAEVKAKLMNSTLPARKVVSAPAPIDEVVISDNRTAEGRFNRVQH